MKPLVHPLSSQEIDQIVQHSTSLLCDPGLIINHPETLQLLADAGAQVKWEQGRASLPERIIARALSAAPGAFSLYSLQGEEAVQYGVGHTSYNPGSSALQILDSHTGRIRPAVTADLAHFFQLVEVLEEIDAQSTALVASDVPESIQDLYRLYVALHYLSKPIITGVFHHSSWGVMHELLVTALGSSQRLREKPLAVFDICPTSPLSWSFTSCQNLLDNARAFIPVQIISMPMAGATAPATLAGALAQGTAESLAGVVIAQLAQQGTPVVWGGSPAVFDMKSSTAPMGAAGTWLLTTAYAQVGRSLGLPTQGYAGISDAKLVDAQSGMESAAGCLLGALAGLDMISGAGMLAQENCQSPEKLLLDVEMIAQVEHYLRGIRFGEEFLALDLIRQVDQRGDFISQEHTFQWFKQEVHYPSGLIDRQPVQEWVRTGSKDAWQRAREAVQNLPHQYPGPTLDTATRAELRRITTLAASQAGMDRLPGLPQREST